jgi:trigger factor
MLLGDLIESNPDGTEKEGGLMGRTTISLEFLKDAATRQSLLGKSKGEEVSVDPHKVSESHDDLARILGVDHDRVHHLHGSMLFRIAEIKRIAPRALDQEFFDRVYGKDEVKDETGFRGRVRERLETMYRRDSERLFTKLVMKKLYEKNRFELPDAFLKRWILETSEKPVTPEEVEASYADYADGLRRQLVQDKLIEKYGLEAKPQEIQGFAQRYVVDQFTQYGIPAPEEPKLNEMTGRILGDREQVQRMRDTIVDQKLVTHMKTLLAPKERRVGVEEFVNLARTD